MNNDIELLLHPRSIAIIGASAKKGKIGNAIMRNLRESPAKVFPINPHEKTIEGFKCYRSIDEINQKTDVAVIVLPAEKTLEEAKKVADEHIPFLIISSAGFSETGESGRKIENEIAAYTKNRGTRVLGPNTLGVCSPLSGIDTMIIPKERSPRPDKGNLGIISQSGSVQVSLLERAAAMRVGVSYAVGLGNRSDVSELDILRFFENDPDTEVIAMYLESFLDGRNFLELARRISIKKPIIAIKAGSTEAGSRAASSHTGALSKGSDALVEGAFRQAGVIRAHDDEELIDYAMALMMMPAAKGNRVAYVGSAGGIGVMASDYIEGSKIEPPLEMAKLSDQTRHSLHEFLFGYSSIENPVDLTASSTPALYDGSVKRVLGDSAVDLLILSIDMQPPMMDDQVFDHITSWVTIGKPIVGTSTGGEVALRAISKMQSLGIPSYPSLSRCMKAAKALYQRGMILHKIKQDSSKGPQE